MGMKTKLVSAVVALAVAAGIGSPAAMSASPRKMSQKAETPVKKTASTPQQIAGWRAKVEALVDSGPNWLESRLMMHWRTRASQEFIKGEFYAGVDTADASPAPTVMLNGARSHGTSYARPRLADLTPYGSDDPRGLYLANNSLPGKPMEWASISATGNIIGSVNNEIGGLAETAARVWDATGERKFADAAARVFDTYMTGIYYKKEPYDLNHGHQQTLVGLQSFEVIHEDALDKMVGIYTILKPFLAENYGDKIPVYEAAFKKWADRIEANGVPHNNWNFMQARYILKVALLLNPDSTYADGKGREHYIRKVMNDSSIRQWSLPKLASYGYDPATGIWAECAGYSMVVLNDFTDLADIVGRELGIDLVEELPVIAKAAEAYPQYMMPDSRTIAFGDTHPDRIKPQIYERLVRNAGRFGKSDIKRRFEQMLADVKADNLSPYVTSTFYAPNASWLVQRTGMHPDRSLMIALNGSEGNHMHANGISMELYGHGLRLAPDGGIGQTLYSGIDYHEYYSQFPAHNTVCVDGVSSYPVMKSNHPFEVRGLYPASGSEGVGKAVPFTYSDLYFLEPETTSDQRRVNAIVATSDSTGFYVDIFRSRRRNGRDKFHDYFYHNMGQRMEMSAPDGSSLGLQPTQELAFAGAHLGAYSYLFDKRSATTESPVRATFTVDRPDSTQVEMRMWMAGAPERTVFSALSPMTEGLSRIPDMPYDIKATPTLTYVARQHGEAWNRPFVAVFEPSASHSPSRIASVDYPAVKADMDGSHVALLVKEKSGAEYLVINTDTPEATLEADGLRMNGSTAMASDNRWFLAGTRLDTPEFTLQSPVPVEILVERDASGGYTCRPSLPDGATLTAN